MNRLERPNQEGDRYDLPDGQLFYWSAAFDKAQADRWLKTLTASIDWRQEYVRLPGKRVPMPRLSAWYGDPGCSYRYSGHTYQPSPWTETLQDIRLRVEAISDAVFNSVLLNLYRDGSDSMSWHSDAEPELGRDPLIASVSLGGVRRFKLRHKRLEEAGLDLDLAHGSLLVMAGSLQHHWRHALPKTRRPVAARINLTFRLIKPVG